ncbi:MAG: hypothetical protein KGH65_02085 [Candidatus Micrarchaeota archaeon]|nr:hypothetical protein [Candidatus Micrarchaeota archaeon]
MEEESELEILVNRLLFEEKEYISKLAALNLVGSIGGITLSEKKMDSEEMSFEELDRIVMKGFETYAAELKRLNDDYLSSVNRTISRIREIHKEMSE